MILFVCSHTFCLGCLEELPDKVCPFCMKVIEREVTSLPRNFTLLSLMSELPHLLLAAGENKKEELPITFETPQGRVCQLFTYSYFLDMFVSNECCAYCHHFVIFFL